MAKLKVSSHDKGQIIKIIREWTGLTQVQFAESIGKSRVAVQEYEKGRINYGIDTLIQIAEVHGLEITIEKK